MCAIVTWLHTVLRSGENADVDPSLEAILGHASHSLEKYIRDHRDAWAPAAAAEP
jgi:hypothetical protein